MGILDEVMNGGGPPIMKFDGRAGVYKVRDREETFNNQEFVAHILEAKGGRIKFDRYGGPPDRCLGSIFPEDEAPSRSSLGDTDESKWPKGKFGDEPEDPWTPTIEVPLTHRQTGEQYLFAAQSKTALSAAKDFIALCRRLPEGYEPTVRLTTGSYKGRFGEVRKPVLQIIGRVAIEKDPNDEIPF